MRRSLICIILALSPAVTAAEAPVRPELELIDAFFDEGSYELSGGAITGGQLLLVSDEPTDTTILTTPYPPTAKAAPGKAARLTLKPAIDLAKLAGFEARAVDLEGVAVCPDLLYLANERAREILAVDVAGRKISKVPLAYDLAALAAGGPNAGFEGVAVDCAGKVLYVAKERDPRRLLAFSLPDGKLLREGDAAPSDRAGQRVINHTTGQGLLEIGPDFADLVFDAGFLYGLERNTKEIVKLDPQTFEALARVSYFKEELELYDTGEPFGTAEVLILSGSQLLVAFDNNGAPLSSVARRKYGVEGPHGALLRFKRPEGF